MNLLNPPRLDKTAVKKSFNRCAGQYDSTAVLQEEVLSRLLERLDYIRVTPELILDLGCGTGAAVRPLHKRYKKSTVLALDMADEMLAITRKKYGMFKSKWLLNADMEQLPLKDNCVDLLFSSLALQWSNDLEQGFREFKRVGRQGGLMMFSTFGSNTLKELRDSWARVDASPRVHNFLDMHDVGDMMLAAGLSQPVVDMEEIRMEYASFSDLLSDLKSIGATNADKSRQRGLMTARKLNRLRQAYEEIAYRDNVYTATYEIVYGHAWF
ncbi:MAG: malonyl-ACP O-methyltransferase BioC [Gammaproteobacteria bacterium]|nr:malonyl-ACP O-methyltransferase BioC [Gammaproteobacteria bacterium]MBL6998678.1 malonyl-ACP O-methyltransferase BioC [Gammaproteobacteria bacterium]